MRAVWLFSSGLFALVLIGGPSLANLGPPVRPQDYLKKPDKDAKPLDKVPGDKVVRVLENAPVSLTYRSDVTRPQMRVPKKFVVVEGKAQAGLDVEAPGTSARTMLAGLALSAGFVSGGFWLMRRGGRAAKPLLILGIFCAGLFCSPLLDDLSGNSGPIRLPPKGVDAVKFEGATANLGMDVTITTDGDRIQLILPKQLLPLVMVPPQELNPFGGLGRFGGLGLPNVEPKKSNDKKKDGE